MAELPELPEKNSNISAVRAVSNLVAENGIEAVYTVELHQNATGLKEKTAVENSAHKRINLDWTRNRASRSRIYSVLIPSAF